MLTVELVIELGIIFTTKMVKKLYTNNILLASLRCEHSWSLMSTLCNCMNGII